MPILAAEPDHFPNGLFESESATDSHERRWWALHTKPRQEKSLARWLSAARMTYYLPTYERRNRIRGRVLSSRVPLFPGYLFLHADRAARIDALSTNRVVRSIEVGDQDELWNDLRQVHRLINSGLPIAPETRLIPGMQVEVIQGPLTGMRGTVCRSASGNRFIVHVDFIQQGASVLLDDCALIPLGPVPAIGA